MLNYQTIASREGYVWHASRLTAERILSGGLKKWYTLVYCITGIADEYLLDVLSVHVLHGSASAHFIGVNSSSAYLLYTSVFEAISKLSPIVRPSEPLCSFSEGNDELNVDELKRAFWGCHMAMDCGSGEGGIVIHTEATPEHLRSLVMGKWPDK